MGCVLHRVNHRNRAHTMCLINEFLDIGNRSAGVGRPVDSQHLGLIRQLGAEVLKIQRDGLRVDFDALDHHAEILQGPPG